MYIYAPAKFFLRSMGDFFGGLRAGIGRGPDVIMNQGPLPTLGAGGSAGFQGIPDGKINETSSLLSGINPYAYAEPARMGSQAGYQNIPWVVQRLVPQISIPKAAPGKGSFMALSHQVDDGDIAFVIRGIFSRHPILVGKDRLRKQGVFNRCDPICNLPTVNYLLHGLIRYGADTDNQAWNLMAIALGLEETIAEYQNAARGTNIRNLKRQRDIAWFICKQLMFPFGIARGSEKQGGQHQGYPFNSSVTYPVDLATSLVVNGKVINLINLWRNHNINSGDDLVLYLERKKTTVYNLSHHPACYNVEEFPALGQDEEVWQLVPGVSSCTCDKFQSAVEEIGYIHVARSQVHRLKFPTTTTPEARADHVTNGGLLQVTFSPVVVTAKPLRMRGEVNMNLWNSMRKYPAGDARETVFAGALLAARQSWSGIRNILALDAGGNADLALKILDNLVRERELWTEDYIQPMKVLEPYANAFIRSRYLFFTQARQAYVVPDEARQASLCKITLFINRAETNPNMSPYYTTISEWKTKALRIKLTDKNPWSEIENLYREMQNHPVRFLARPGYAESLGEDLGETDETHLLDLSSSAAPDAPTMSSLPSLVAATGMRGETEFARSFAAEMLGVAGGSQAAAAEMQVEAVGKEMQVEAVAKEMQVEAVEAEGNEARADKKVEGGATKRFKISQSKKMGDGV